MRAAPNGVVSIVYEVLVEMTDGTGRTAFGTWDIRHTEKDANEVAARLRKQKKNVKVVDRDYKKPQREDRDTRGRGRKSKDEDDDFGYGY